MAKEITLTAAMRANLVSLQNTEVLLNRTQERLATGKKVNSALDNPLNYFAAAGHTERANQLITRKDGMGEAIQTIKAANTGIEGIKSLLENLRGLVEAARSSTDTSVQQNQANEVVSQIIQLVQDSGYKGVNFLNGTAVSLDVLFNETGSNKLTLTGFQTIAAGGTMSAMSGISNGSLISTSMQHSFLRRVEPGGHRFSHYLGDVRAQFAGVEAVVEPGDHQLATGFHQPDGEHAEGRGGQTDAGRYQ
jgi:flagellin